MSASRFCAAKGHTAVVTSDRRRRTGGHRDGKESRADLIEEIGKPGAGCRVPPSSPTRSGRWQRGRNSNLAVLQRAAEACVAAARQIRKVVIRAVTSRRELALAPERLTGDDLFHAVGAMQDGQR